MATEENNIVEKDSGFKTLVVPAITGGYDKDQPAYLMDDDRVENCKNLIIKRGKLQLDTGYTDFGAAVIGAPRLVFQFYLTTGASYLTLLTNLRMYYWNVTESQWQLTRHATYADTTLTAQSNAGATTVTVASTTGFASDGLVIGIILDDGTEHQTTTVGVPVGFVVTIAAAIPTGRYAAIGAQARRSRTFAGDSDEPVQVAVAAAYDWMIITNGANVPRYYDGDATASLPLMISGLTSAQCCAVFQGYVLIANTVESGSNYHQRIRWNYDVSTNDWDPAVSPTSGYIDLYDTEDWIQQMVPMGPYLIIYRERSIYRCEFIGSTDQTFSFTNTITGEGAISGASVADMGDFHLVCGQSNIYEYRGGFDMTAVGDDVWYVMFGTEGNLSPEYKYRTMCLYVEELEEFWVAYRSTATSSEFPDRMLRYRPDIKTWTWRQLTDPISGFGYYQRNSSVSWNNCTNPWTTYSNPWDAIVFLTNSFSVLLCGGDALQCFEYDYTTATDSGTELDWNLTTRAWYDPSYIMMVDSLVMKGTGGTVNIYYRTEEDGAWNTWGTLSMGATTARYKTWKQFCTRYLQFKFTGTGGGFSLEYIAITFQKTTEW